MTNEVTNTYKPIVGFAALAAFIAIVAILNFEYCQICLAAINEWRMEGYPEGCGIIFFTATVVGSVPCIVLFLILLVKKMKYSFHLREVIVLTLLGGILGSIAAPLFGVAMIKVIKVFI